MHLQGKITDVANETRSLRNMRHVNKPKDHKCKENKMIFYENRQNKESFCDCLPHPLTKDIKHEHCLQDMHSVANDDNQALEDDAKCNEQSVENEIMLMFETHEERKTKFDNDEESAIASVSLSFDMKKTTSDDSNNKVQHDKDEALMDEEEPNDNLDGNEENEDDNNEEKTDKKKLHVIECSLD